MIVFILILAGIGLALAVMKRVAFRCYLYQWKKMIRDKPKIPIYTSEPMWIPCATDMSDADDYEK